jgi:hypothetical protein
LKLLEKYLYLTKVANTKPKEMAYFVDQLLGKIEELNYRAKDVSMQSLLLVTEFVDPRSVLQRLLEFPKPVSKTPQRVLLTRFDILK